MIPSNPASMNQDDFPSSQTPVVIALALTVVIALALTVVIALALTVVIALALTY